MQLVTHKQHALDVFITQIQISDLRWHRKPSYHSVPQSM